MVFIPWKGRMAKIKVGGIAFGDGIRFKSERYHTTATKLDSNRVSVKTENISSIFSGSFSRYHF